MILVLNMEKYLMNYNLQIFHILLFILEINIIKYFQIQKKYCNNIIKEIRQ